MFIIYTESIELGVGSFNSKRIEKMFIIHV